MVKGALRIMRRMGMQLKLVRFGEVQPGGSWS